MKPVVHHGDFNIPTHEINHILERLALQFVVIHVELFNDFLQERSAQNLLLDRDEAFFNSVDRHRLNIISRDFLRFYEYQRARSIHFRQQEKRESGPYQTHDDPDQQHPFPLF
jgi:hypothetical protein